MVGEKRALWQALVFTLIIFAVGFLFGFALENSRADDVQLALINSEISSLDQQVRTRGINQFEIECAPAKESAFKFADKIYEESSKLELLDSSSKFTETLKILHKKYDLLRVILWMEAIELKKQCDEIHTVVYIFEYASEDNEKKALQSAFSRLLLDEKNEHPDEILLIPIAGNLDIESANLILEKYEVDKLPVVIINEKKIIYELTSRDELEKEIFTDSDDARIFLS